MNYEYVDARTSPTIKNFPGLLAVCIDRLNDAIVITEAHPVNTPGPRIVWANQVFYERNGYSPEEVLGQSPRILQGPATDRATLDRVRAALESWQSVRVETLNYRKDGTTYWNEFEIVPIADEKGEFTHWVSVQRDISERKQFEKILGASDSALKAISQGVLIGDAKGKISSVNEAFQTITGFAKDEILGRTCQFLQGPATDASTVEAIRQTLERGAEYAGEIINYRKDGTTFWNDLRISPVFNAHGQVAQFIGITRDITEHKQTEEKLVLAASVFTHSREGILITDANGLIVDVNEAFTRITSYSREEVLGQNPRKLSSGRHDKSFYATLWRNLLDTGHWSGEIWNQRKCGEIYVASLKISAVRDQLRVVRQYVAIFADISERKAMEEKLRQLAFYDPLTGLPNRRLLDDRLGQTLLASKRSGLYGALMFLDLDNFKPINDLHGHDVGDLLLVEVARRLIGCVREVDTVARLGGDEFVVLLSELDGDKVVSTEQARVVAGKIRDSVAAPYQLTVAQVGQSDTRVEHHCSASIGVVMFVNDETSQSDVMKWADAAMYQAKEAGRNRVQFYEKFANRSPAALGACKPAAQGLPVTPGDDNGEPTGGFNRLLGDCVQRENALQASEAFKNTVLNSLNAEIAVVDRAGVILAVNDRWQQFARENGFEPGQSAPNTGVGSNYFSVCGPPGSAGRAGDVMDASTGLQAVLDGRLESFNLDYPCDSPTQQRWFAMTVMPLGKGVRNGAVITHTDITKRKQAEEKLRLAARVFSDAHEGITITNAEGIIVEVNEAFTRITGYTREEALGQNPRFLQSGRQDKAFYAAMWHSLNEQGHWSGQMWNLRKSGEVIAEHISISSMRDADGSTLQYVAHFTDISESIKAQAQIDTLAFYDQLTQLPNRRLLLDRLDQALHVSTRHARNNALLFVDLDDFKTLNDTLGHSQGDLLLVQVAQRIKACIRDGDTLARLGSDEFVVMLEDLSEDMIEAATQAETAGDKILATFVADFVLDSGAYHGTPSVGITLFGGLALESNEQPLKRAELAMFQAKAAGRNMLRFFDPQMQAEVSAHATLAAELREAVIKQQFVLYYQPQVVGAGRITGVEALVRWNHPQRGMVSPAEFIPLAEETGLILPLGQWVLENACLQLAAWALHPERANLTVAVNVSARQFQQSNFVDSVVATLERTRAKPKLLKLELTESMLVDDVEAIITKMGVLKSLGVTFSLDDFGTGYSSLAYLKRLPLDQLKIDQGFVQNIVTDSNDAVIAKMVVVLAESMGLSVIAEGVELQAQADFLAHLGCHAYQGYLFSRPLSLAALEALTLGG